MKDQIIDRAIVEFKQKWCFDYPSKRNRSVGQYAVAESGAKIKCYWTQNIMLEYLEKLINSAFDAGARSVIDAWEHERTAMFEGFSHKHPCEQCKENHK